MGLFSKKQHAQTVREAIDYKDNDFAYTTRTGRRYDRLQTASEILYENIMADDLDDAFEMYAPNLLATIEETNKNMKILLEQNLLLQNKICSLEDKILNMEQTHNAILKR